MTCNLTCDMTVVVTSALFSVQPSLYKKSHSQLDSQPLSVNSGPSEVCCYSNHCILSLCNNNNAQQQNYSSSYGRWLILVLEVLDYLYFCSWQVVHCVSSSDFDPSQVKSFERFGCNIPLFLLMQYNSSDSGGEGGSRRCERLNTVRKLFWQTYRLFSDETSPSSTRSLTGLLSRLATSVGMGGNSNTWKFHPPSTLYMILCAESILAIIKFFIE